ncbi:uncharacterized protein cubi_03351 [Cryptosporidium ubiquitum]|uniref:Uncharacterized protein n=1 Tax=Cryptosporidium ubiquitum TaxID=857276 RepID=A0A1J4MH35_9CRYT|nr:uncharacterized protein cubi_03351 [Cryptosporidium ubiquitum]OII73553.1 hypothetical protein cubi_03351 [Cryptosporidium ubiquitum]
MLNEKNKKYIHSKLHEKNGKNNIYMKNIVYGDENLSEINNMEYPVNTLLRNKGLPEKLEKHLNNEKERELESLYEENRQLLVEISKLRKTNQLLVKDVNKKNEIIDNLDSNLVEVEEKLENAKKKNWNMYNEILNREKKNQQQDYNKDQSIDSDHIDNETYKLKESKIGTFNTVNIIKPSSKKEFNNRPKSTSISTSTENTKWLQDMILQSLSEKHAEKKAYDNLKYEVEKLQKEIYSMQTDLLKNNQQDEIIQEPIIDQSNGKLSVFHSTNSSNNNSTTIIGTSVSGFNTINSTFHSTSLAQELKEINCTTNNSSINSLQESEDTQEKLEKENDQENLESIPPRSVHILMGKTFSRENNIDRKINKYKNGSRYNSENLNGENLIQPMSNHYNSYIKQLQTQVNHQYQQPSITNTNNNNYYYSSNMNNNHQNYHNPHSNNYFQTYTNNTNPFLSISANDNNNTNGHLYNFQHNSYYNSVRRPVNFPKYENNNINSLYMDNLADRPSLANSIINSSLAPKHLNQGHTYYQYSKHNVPESKFNLIPTQTSTPMNIPSSNPFYTQTLNQNSYSNIPFPPFKIKITQRFRRNRNNSVPPPRPQNDFSSEKMVTDENQPVPGQIESLNSNNDVEKELPQGYIRFKTSISSPLSQDDFFSPISANINNICPCDKAIDSCAFIQKKPIQHNEDKNKTRSLSTSLPLPISLIAKNNQFQGTSGLLKFAKY